MQSADRTPLTPFEQLQLFSPKITNFTLERIAVVAKEHGLTIKIKDVSYAAQPAMTCVKAKLGGKVAKSLRIVLRVIAYKVANLPLQVVMANDLYDGFGDVRASMPTVLSR